MRHGRAAAVAATILAMCVPPISGQAADPDQISDALRALLDGAFTVHIRARIFDSNDNETIWDMDLTRVTVSGRSVGIRLDGSNTVVEADFTPVVQADGDLMLIAEGRTWIDTGQNEPEFRTAFTTLPIDLGEPIRFLPLGTTSGSGQLPVETDHFGRMNIELEINVERYSS